MYILSKTNSQLFYSLFVSMFCGMLLYGFLRSFFVSGLFRPEAKIGLLATRQGRDRLCSNRHLCVKAESLTRNLQGHWPWSQYFQMPGVHARSGYGAFYLETDAGILAHEIQKCIVSGGELTQLPD